MGKRINEEKERTLQDAGRLSEAVRFATEKHAGQFRKGTTIPYIVHPLEVMSILVGMDADANLLIAGVLHDTVEDTDATATEIAGLFGGEVAMLVDGHSEDKSKSWEERKETEFRQTMSAPLGMQKLVLADKLANLRSMQRDLEAVGEALWERFKAGKEKQGWYYGMMIDALDGLQRDEKAARFYWEMKDVYKEVFVGLDC